MTGYVTVIGGVNNGSLTGRVSVPSTLSQASVTQSGSFLNTVQNFLGGATDSVLAGTYNLYNLDTVAGQTFAFSAGTPAGGIYEITNTDSLGHTTAGSVSVNASVSGAYNTIVLEAPGNTTLTGNGASVASTYVLGSQTNAIVSTEGSGSGTNTIYGLGGNDTIYAGGNNQATFVGGVDRYKALSGGNTVVASGNATMQAGIPTTAGAGTTIDFINNSTAQATVFGEAGSVTAYGGNAGGLYYGGSAGNNSLVGGAGMATLVGSVSGDTLEAGFTQNGTSIASALNNYLYAGAGNETLIASAGTQNNLLELGTGSDVVSTEGSGYQYFFSSNTISSSTATITGTSPSSGGINYYFLGTTANGSGAFDVITNYNSINSHLYAYNGDVISSISNYSGTQGSGALVHLSDGTQVLLVGVSASHLTGTGTSALFYT